MGNSQVLQKAIERAKQNGWKTQIVWDDYYDYPVIYDNDGDYTYVATSTILFDHDFAQALWKEKDYIETIYHYPESLYRYEDKTLPRIPEHATITASFKYPAWQYHIQQLALAEDRIGYLREYLEGKK